MDKKQKINCNVDSCTHNNTENQECELEEITVEPALDMPVGDPEEESMCGDYEPEEEEGEQEQE